MTLENEEYVAPIKIRKENKITPNPKKIEIKNTFDIFRMVNDLKSAG